MFTLVSSRPDYKYENLKERITVLLDKNNISIDFMYTNVRNKGLFCKDA